MIDKHNSEYIWDKPFNLSPRAVVYHIAPMQIFARTCYMICKTVYRPIYLSHLFFKDNIGPCTQEK